MLINRQVQTTNQYDKRYVLERNNSHYNGDSSFRRKQNSLQTNNNNNLKSLQNGAERHVSFKGLTLYSVKHIFTPIVKKVPTKLTKTVFESLAQISDEQYRYYNDIRKTYVNLVKNSDAFCKKYHINDVMRRNITEEELYYLPKKQLPHIFIENIVSPVTFLYKGAKNLLQSKKSTAYLQNKQFEKAAKEFSSLEGLLNSHEIWENGYRRVSGHSLWSQEEDFLIPKDVLLSKLNRRRNKVVDPNKGKYSTSSLMIGNRFISGIVYAYFLGNDAYNTTMRYSNNKEEAGSQRKSRIAQEFSRIGLNMYIQNLLFGTFEAIVNRSISAALLVSGSTAAFSEILGRKLVGKPIVPSDKETLDKLEKNMHDKKGILPAIGRLLTNVKKKEPINKMNEAVSSLNLKDVPNTKVFSMFSSTNAASVSQNSAKNASFKGYYNVDKMFNKNRIMTIINAIETFDKKQAEHMKEIIAKGFKKSELYNVFEKNPEMFKKTDTMRDIPIGTQKTVYGQWTKSLLVPVTFVQDLYKSSKQLLIDTYNRFTGNEAPYRYSKMSKFYNTAKKSELNKFNAFLEERLNEPVWRESLFGSDEYKKLKIFEEFIAMRGKDKEEIEGLKNILLWLDKQITRSGIKLEEGKPLSPQDIEKLKKIMKESVLNADIAKNVEYDGNKLSQLNINLARAITTIFLVTDAYNLTMQYSNDNKKSAKKSAKNRAAQEISRISLSAYMLAFVHNLLSKMCNASLMGAFGLTAITSVINDSLSRKVVGVPLTAKSQEELLEIDKKNTDSKSPIKKALAYSLGKKVQPATVETTTPAVNFENEFFIVPKIS